MEIFYLITILPSDGLYTNPNRIKYTHLPVKSTQRSQLLFAYWGDRGLRFFFFFGLSLSLAVPLYKNDYFECHIHWKLYRFFSHSYVSVDLLRVAFEFTSVRRASHLKRLLCTMLTLKFFLFFVLYLIRPQQANNLVGLFFCAAFYYLILYK